MTTKRKLELAGAAILLIACLVFLVQWVSHREALIRAEEREKADQAQIAEREKDIAERERDKQQRDRETATQIAQLQAQVAALKTPQQAAQVIPQYVPMSPLREITAGTPPAFKPGDFVLPSEDAIPLAQALNKCKQDQISLGTCQKDLTDTTSQLEARTGQFTLAEKDAERWKKVAKGGSGWTRAFKVMGYAACAGAGAWVGDKVKPGALAPTVGASAGVLGCHFILK